MPTEVETNEPLPKGNYTLVGIDVDTTGRRLIDEIVQLAAYTPESQFSQYIIPIMNLNPAARQRHQIRVITVGFYRMLKSMQTYKQIVKTKTEYGALVDFLDWIEDLNAAQLNSDGIILVYHEQRKFIPYMILNAMKSYNLLERFLRTIKSFANGFSLAETKCGSTIKYLNLKQLSKVLLNQEEVTEKEKYQFEGNASVRARLAYEVLEHLAKTDAKAELSSAATSASSSSSTLTTATPTDDGDINADTIREKMLDMTLNYTSALSSEFRALENARESLERQNSLRSIFVNYFKVTLFHRVKAVNFRRVLADNGYALESLQKIWDEKKKDGLSEVVSAIEDLKDENKAELVELLDCYFDPDKQAIKPVLKHRNGSRRGGQKENYRPRNNKNNNNNNNNRSDFKNRKDSENNRNVNGKSSEGETNGNKSSPDSTSKSSNRRSNRRRRRSSAGLQNKSISPQPQAQTAVA